MILGTLLGERRIRPEGGLSRTAVLARRGTDRGLLRPLTLLPAAGILALAVTLAYGVMNGVTDPRGRTGAALRTENVLRDMVMREVWVPTPWPGSYYAWPVAGAFAACLLLAAATLIVTSRRCPSAASAEVDAQLRAISVRNVLLAVSMASFATAGQLGCVITFTLAGAGDSIGFDNNVVVLRAWLVMGQLCTAGGLASLVALMTPPRVAVETLQHHDAAPAHETHHA
jgi:hypothetical protein